MRHVILRHIALAAVTAAATPLAAQQADSITIGAHWRPYLGCWASSSAGVVGPTVCIVPTDSAEKVDMLVVVEDSVVSRVPVTASESRVPVTRDGCSGWETARWSGDDHRLYTRGEFACDGGTPQKSSGIYALSQDDAFSRIEGVSTKNGVRVRVVNYIRLDPAAIPLEIARSLSRASALPTVAARADAASPITFRDVSAALKEVDREVVEGWIADRGQRFALTPKELRQLRTDGLPESVIDMMIAVSHPKVFTVQQGGAPVVATAPRPVREQCSMYDTACLIRYANRVNVRYDRRIDEAIMLMYGYGYGSMYLPYTRDYRNAFGYWTPYGGGYLGYAGFNGYSLGGLYGSTWLGNNGWFNNGWSNGWNNVGTPFVIVPTQPAPSAGRGTVVNGRGYTQDGGSSSGIARPSADVNGGGSYFGGGSFGGGAAGGGSSASSGASGGASAGGGDRTAKPRP